MRWPPSSRMVPAGSSAFATATSSSDRRTTAFSVSAYVAMGSLRRSLYRIVRTNRLSPEDWQGGAKGPAAGGRPTAAREAYSSYVERAAEGGQRSRWAFFCSLL